MSDSTLNVLREAVGAYGGPDVVDALRRAPDPATDALADRLLVKPPRPLRPVSPNEVRPLVNARASFLSRGAQAFVDGVGPAGLSVMAAMSPREVGTNTFSDGVIRALFTATGRVRLGDLHRRVHHLAAHPAGGDAPRRTGDVVDAAWLERRLPRVAIQTEERPDADDETAAAAGKDAAAS